MGITAGSLFAGIGGFDLGFERAGIKTLWQVEIDPFCQKVLERHFPDAKRFGDIKECGKHNLEPVDIICGGFPCQDVSLCGKQAGISGPRSGLWSEMYRILCELRPRFAVMENVPGLLVGGMGTVLGDLAAGGFDAEWDCLPASSFMHYHERDRVFIVAHNQEFGGHARDLLEESGKGRALLQFRRLYSMAVATRGEQENVRLESEPRLDRLVHRFPNRTQRLEATGNAVVPQIAEWLGRKIVEACERESHRIGPLAEQTVVPDQV